MLSLAQGPSSQEPTNTRGYASGDSISSVPLRSKAKEVRVAEFKAVNSLVSVLSAAGHLCKCQASTAWSAPSCLHYLMQPVVLQEPNNA